MANRNGPDWFARFLATLSLLTAAGGLYFTYHSNQRDDQAASEANARAALQRRAEDYLQQVGRPYIYVDGGSINQYIAAVLPLYRDPLEHDHNALPQDLGHAGLTARIQRFLQPLRSLQDQFTDVNVVATTANRYHITAVGRLDRTYFDGQQPEECLDRTRFIQDVDLVLDVEEDPKQGWVVVSSDDSTRPNTSECRNPA